METGHILLLLIVLVLVIGMYMMYSDSGPSPNVVQQTDEQLKDARLEQQSMLEEPPSGPNSLSVQAS